MQCILYCFHSDLEGLLLGSALVTFFIVRAVRVALRTCGSSGSKITIVYYLSTFDWVPIPIEKGTTPIERKRIAAAPQIAKLSKHILPVRVQIDSSHDLLINLSCCSPAFCYTTVRARHFLHRDPSYTREGATRSGSKFLITILNSH